MAKLFLPNSPVTDGAGVMSPEWRKALEDILSLGEVLKGRASSLEETALSQTQLTSLLSLLSDDGETAIVSAVGSCNVMNLTNGSTYTPPDDLLFAIVELQGSGGNGATASASFNGGGGAAGDYLRAAFTKDQIGSSQSIVIPTGGSGNDAEFGSLMVAGGGGNGAAPGNGVTRSSTFPSVDYFYWAGQDGFSNNGGSSFFGSGGLAGSGSGATGKSGTGPGAGGGGGTTSFGAGGGGQNGFGSVTEFLRAA